MGCDIHLYRERKVNGVWETDSEMITEDLGTEDQYQYLDTPIGMGRNYCLFGLLSDVRASDLDWAVESPLASGFPEDMVEIHKQLKDDPDYHTPGYCYLEELEDLLKQAKSARTKCALGLGTAESGHWERAEQGLEELLEQVTSNDFFAGLDPSSECRVLICYDN